MRLFFVMSASMLAASNTHYWYLPDICSTSSNTASVKQKSVFKVATDSFLYLSPASHPYDVTACWTKHRRSPRICLSNPSTTNNMADVDMTDAPAPKAKATKAAAESSSDTKKRFEVKKVCPFEVTNSSLCPR